MIRASLVLMMALLSACSFDHGARPGACTSDRECPSAHVCYHGLCVVSGGGAGVAAQACESGAAPESCYDGAPGTQGKGACRSGQRFCVAGAFTKCLDQLLPSAETCNGKDDDCNGMVDDIGEQSCALTGAVPCGSAGKLVCRGGAPSCELATMELTETCNGKDDDCDGKVDELPSVPCFPDGKDGCSIDAAGSPHCKGVCVSGMTQCKGGVASCVGAITETSELCEAASAVAYDQNCDGQVDEGCACSGASSRECYAGPKSTQMGTECGLGTQTCGSDGTWQACGGQALPKAETCTNPGKDDDCNGKVDDVATLGQPCLDPTRKGECSKGMFQCSARVAAPVCVGQAKQMELCDALDQDCDGNPVNGFDLNSEAMCGACDVTCSSGQSCCAGQCFSKAELGVSDANCGMCGKACGTSRYCCQGECLSAGLGSPGSLVHASCQCAQDCGAKSCCGTSCVDLMADKNNCGACGFSCANSNGGGQSGGAKCKAGSCQ